MHRLFQDLFYSIKKHSPEILMFVGVSGVIGGTVIACAETRNIDPILEEHNEEIESIKKASEEGFVVDEETNETADYTEKDKRRDVTVTYLSTGYKLAKLYLPAGLIIGGSIGCILGSHTIMTKRNAGLSAAYIGLSESFNNYRKKIIEKFGESADAEARYNIKAKKVKGKNGEEDHIDYQMTDYTEEEDFTRFFDMDSRYWDKNVKMNLITIYAAQSSIRKRMKTRRSHEVSFNEICGELDLRPDLEKGNLFVAKYRPKDPVDEHGEPINFEILVYVLSNGQKVKKSVDEAISNGDQLDPVMLLDFKGLEPIRIH